MRKKDQYKYKKIDGQCDGYFRNYIVNTNKYYSKKYVIFNFGGS